MRELINEMLSPLCWKTQLCPVSLKFFAPGFALPVACSFSLGCVFMCMYICFYPLVFSLQCVKILAFFSCWSVFKNWSCHFEARLDSVTEKLLT